MRNSDVVIQLKVAKMKGSKSVYSGEILKEF